MPRTAVDSSTRIPQTQSRVPDPIIADQASDTDLPAARIIADRSDPMVLVTRPISAVMLAVTVIALFIVLTPALRKKRKEAFAEEE